MKRVFCITAVSVPLSWINGWRISNHGWGMERTGSAIESNQGETSIQQEQRLEVDVWSGDPSITEWAIAAALMGQLPN